MQVRKSTQLTAYASATTCLGTGKSVGVLCKTAQKRKKKKNSHYNLLHCKKYNVINNSWQHFILTKSLEVFTFTNG
jgi:hypothetical protein